MLQYKSTMNLNVTGLPQLVVSTLDHKPFVWRESAADGERYEGYLKELLDEVSRIAGFQYTFQQASSENFGSYTPQGWNGVIGDVVNKKADIGGAALTLTAQREDIVDFSKPFMANSVNLLVKKPFWFDLGLGYLVRPFSADYWIMLLVVMLLMGLAFFIIGKFSPYEWGNVAADRDPRGAKNSFTLRNSYLFVLSTLTWQGFREAPHSISGRILAAFWWMFVLFSLVAYTSNLTAYFLARPEQMPNLKFKTYEELLESSSIATGALNFGTTQELLRTSRSKALRTLWTKMNAQNSWAPTTSSAVERIKSSDGNFVFFAETVTAEYWARKECDLMLYGENLFPSSMAFAVQKGSLWRSKISDAITELRTNGFMEQLKNKFWRFSGACTNIDGREYSDKGGFLSSMPVYPVTLKDMSVAILLLFLGAFAAIVFLIVEIVHYQVTKKGKKIEKPKFLNAKIFKPKSKSAKPAPSGIEAGDEEAGPSSDGLECVPLNDADETPVSDELRVEGEHKAEV